MTQQRMKKRGIGGKQKIRDVKEKRKRRENNRTSRNGRDNEKKSKTTEMAAMREEPVQHDGDTNRSHH